MRRLFHGSVRAARQFWLDLKNLWVRERRVSPPIRPPVPAGPPKYHRLARVVLTDEVSRTLFQEYAAHRGGPRGREETGWVLLGLRDSDQAVVLATLPAGAESEAGVAHVRFNPSAQAIGSRIVRQADRRLTIVGVVHTHPGSLRHPSEGDYRGDIAWVEQLRGGEGVFGIGTAEEEVEKGETPPPKPHAQRFGDLMFSWYALRGDDNRYRPLPCEITLGPDLARPLHPLWSTIEAHAGALERVFSQQARVRFDIVSGKKGQALAVHVPLAEPGDAVRVLLEGEGVRYFWQKKGDLLAFESKETRMDRGLYLMLAELAARS